MTTRNIVGLFVVLILACLVLVANTPKTAPAPVTTTAPAPATASVAAADPLSRFTAYYRDTQALTMEIDIKAIEDAQTNPVMTVRIKMTPDGFNSQMLLPGESKPAISFLGAGNMITEWSDSARAGPYEFNNTHMRLQNGLPPLVLCASSLARSTWLGEGALWPGLIAEKLEKAQDITNDGERTHVRYDRPGLVNETFTIDKQGRLVRWEQFFEDDDLTKVYLFRYQ